MMFPFGVITWSGICVALMSVMGVFVVRKWTLTPMLAIKQERRRRCQGKRFFDVKNIVFLLVTTDTILVILFWVDSL